MDWTRTENLIMTSHSPALLCAWEVGAGLPILQAAKPRKSRKPLALGTQPPKRENWGHCRPQDGDVTTPETAKTGSNRGAVE